MKPILHSILGLILTSCLQAARKPNVLYIMSDDHAAHGISAYGSRLAKIAPTPNQDLCTTTNSVKARRCPVAG